MKILIVGSDYVWSIERLYKKYLTGSGAAEVSLFAAQNIFYSYYQRSIFHKLLFRAGLSRIYQRINQSLKAEIEKIRPDVIWVFKGMEVLPDTLAWCRKKGIYLANFNGDNPFIFSGAGSGNKNVTQSLSEYDLHFTYNLEIKSRLDKEYSGTTALLPFGFDLEDRLYESASGQEEINRVCFLGNPDRMRADFILNLADGGICIDVYGSEEWGRLVRHPSVGIFPAIYGDEFWKTLRRYRVQLNLMRPHNENSHNMRSFEIPGIGGIMLAPATLEHQMFFENGKDAFLYRGVEDCIEQAKHILSLSSEEAEKVREQARQRSLKDGYSYRDRAKSVLLQLQKSYAQAGHHSF